MGRWPPSATIGVNMPAPAIHTHMASNHKLWRCSLCRGGSAWYWGMGATGCCSGNAASMLKCMLSVITTTTTTTRKPAPATLVSALHTPPLPYLSLTLPHSPRCCSGHGLRPSLAALGWSLFTHRLHRNAVHHAVQCSAVLAFA